MAIYVGLEDIAQTAVVTADSVYAGLPPTNVLTSPMGEVWRFPGSMSGGDKAGRIFFDFGGPKTYQMVMMAVARPIPPMIAGARARITAANTGPSNSDVYNGEFQDWTYIRGYHTFITPNPITSRYLAIRLVYPTTMPYGQVGRVYIGQMLTLQNMAEGGNSFSLSDSNFLRARKNQKLSISTVTEAQADQLETLMLSHGTQKQVAIVADSRRLLTSSTLGKFTSLDLPSPIGFWDSDSPLYTASLSYMEDK